MRSLTIHAHTPYNIYIGNHILNDLGKAVAKEFSPCTAAIITDDIVANLYLDKVKNSLERQGFQVITFHFPMGNTQKPHYLRRNLRILAGKQLTRGDLIVALGGGVCRRYGRICRCQLFTWDSLHPGAYHLFCRPLIHPSAGRPPLISKRKKSGRRFLSAFPGMVRLRDPQDPDLRPICRRHCRSGKIRCPR